MQKQKFLVALDVTEDATEVMEAARKLADKCKARLICLSLVRPLSGVYGSLYFAPYTTATVSFEEEALRQTQDRLISLATQYGVHESDVYSKVGAPGPEIRAAAKEFKCDLIIMGTHGRSGFGRLLGSTAQAVLHGLPCDVHLVKVDDA